MQTEEFVIACVAKTWATLYKRRTVFSVLIPRWIKIRFLEVELDFITGFTQGSAVIFILELTRFVEISV
jgi:hypothetical protein